MFSICIILFSFFVLFRMVVAVAPVLVLGGGGRTGRITV